MESEMESIPNSKEKEKGRVQRVLSGKERGGMSEIKLKPCPFCGGEAILKRDRIGLYCVKCTNCGCMTTYQFYFGEGEEVSKRKAADVWNRRDENESRTDKERNET